MTSALKELKDLRFYIPFPLKAKVPNVEGWIWEYDDNHFMTEYRKPHRKTTRI